jgi:hypothetical protein
MVTTKQVIEMTIPKLANAGSPPETTSSVLGLGSPLETTSSVFGLGSPPKTTNSVLGLGFPPKTTSSALGRGSPPETTSPALDLGSPPKTASSAFGLKLAKVLQVYATIPKFANAGSPSETSSSVLGLKLDEAQQIDARDPLQMARLVDSVKEKSAKYRCALSQRLMVSPVMTPDEDYYEQSVIEAHPSLSNQLVFPSLKLKAKITAFSKESLVKLSVYLTQPEPLESVLDLVAECLSVLSFEDEIKTILKVLGSVEGEPMQRLTEKLAGYVSEEELIILLSVLAQDMPVQTLCLARLVLKQPAFSANAFEDTVGILTGMLSQASLCHGTIELVEEVCDRLSSEQLGKMSLALRSQTRDEEVEHFIDGLQLKEAYLRLREGDSKAAINLVSTLHSSPSLEGKVLEFYEAAGYSNGKVAFLKQKLGTALEAVSSESPSVAATLDIIQRLLNVELQTLRSEVAEPNSSLRAEVAALKNELAESQRLLRHTREELRQLARTTQDLQQMVAEDKAKTLRQDEPEPLPSFIYGYEERTNNINRTDLSTGAQSFHEVPSYEFKPGCCWSELPGGSLLITGGGPSTEVATICTETFEVTQQPPMSTARQNHIAVYNDNHVYVLGGRGPLEECERYLCAQGRWEDLPPLPRASAAISGVVVEDCLYALGGYANGPLDLIQRLNLEGLTWELMSLQLPHAGSGIPCFKLSKSQVYLLLKKTVFSFKPQTQQIQPLKTLSEDIYSWRGPSYYSNGTLYCSSSGGGPVSSLVIGGLR